jgi:hypothetical protein
MLATFLTGSLLTLLIPLAMLIAVGLVWYWLAHRGDEF